MRIVRFILPVFALGLVVPGIAQESSPTPEQLIELSRKASDLTEIGPYQLQANVIFAPGTSRAVKGQITVFRDKDRYRSELQIQNFHESRWITDNTLYIGRSQPVPLPRTTLLRQLDRLWRPSPIPGDAKVFKTSKHKQHGEELECVEIKNQDTAGHKLCFDPSTSALVTESKFEFHDLEFQDFHTIDQKLFPRRITFRDDVGVFLEVTDISVTKASFTPDAFFPPQGASGFPTCDEPTVARKVKHANPRIPSDQMRFMPRAEVYLYGIIGTEGTVQNISVEYSPHAAFTASAVDAIKQWQYTPASCSGKAVPSEMETSMRYFTR